METTIVEEAVQNQTATDFEIVTGRVGDPEDEPPVEAFERVARHAEVEERGGMLFVRTETLPKTDAEAIATMWLIAKELHDETGLVIYDMRPASLRRSILTEIGDANGISITVDAEALGRVVVRADLPRWNYVYGGNSLSLVVPDAMGVTPDDVVDRMVAVEMWEILTSRFFDIAYPNNAQVTRAIDSAGYRKANVGGFADGWRAVAARNRRTWENTPSLPAMAEAMAVGYAMSGYNRLLNSAGSLCYVACDIPSASWDRFAGYLFGRTHYNANYAMMRVLYMRPAPPCEEGVADGLTGEVITARNGLLDGVIDIDGCFTYGTAFRTSVCERCGTRHETAHMERYGQCRSRWVCRDCIDEGRVVCCARCGDYIDRGDAICVAQDDCDSLRLDAGACDDNGSLYICDNCVDDDYRYCAECGDLRHVDDMTWCEEESEWYCSACGHPTGKIYAYSYKPDPVFYGEAGNRRYFGLEIETDSRDCDDDDAAQFARDLGNSDEFKTLIYCKHDGSLDYGCECVTHPMSYDYGMGVDWEQFHSLAVDNRMRSHDARTCGLHIHVSRDGMGSDSVERELTAAKCVLFVDEHFEDMVKLSRRKMDAIEQWAQKNDAKICAGDSRDMVIDKAKVSSAYSRYRAVNLENHDTVEFRLWRGTTNPNTIRATIDLTNAIVQFAMQHTVKEMCEEHPAFDCLKPYVKEGTIAYMRMRGLGECEGMRPDDDED